eukprot:8554902-Alexandrium_andersonii.AAC.1
MGRAAARHSICGIADWRRRHGWGRCPELAHVHASTQSGGPSHCCSSDRRLRWRLDAGGRGRCSLRRVGLSCR